MQRMCEHFAGPFLLTAAWVAALAALAISLQPAALAVLRLAHAFMAFKAKF